MSIITMYCMYMYMYPVTTCRAHTNQRSVRSLQVDNGGILLAAAGNIPAQWGLLGDIHGGCCQVHSRVEHDHILLLLGRLGEEC